MKTTLLRLENGKVNYLTFIMAACFLLWSALIVSSFFISDGAEKISILAAKIEFGVHFFTILFLMQVCWRYRKEDNKAMLWLLMISIMLFLVDFCFYIAAYANNTFLTQISLVEFLLYYFPCIVGCFLLIVFVAKVLLKEVLQHNKFIKILMVLIIINVITMSLFLSSIHYAFNVISWETISQVGTLAEELILFDFAIVGLIYAANLSALLLLTGIIILLSGDYFLTYSYISQTVHLFSYGELLWLMGLLFIMFAVLNVKQTGNFNSKNWFISSNMIKSQLAFWAFSISISGFLLFFIIVYGLSIVDKRIFVGLPLFVMMYSVIAVILAIIMGKNFEAPFKKIESNIEKLKQADGKAYIGDDFSIEEFIYLQKFIIDAFEFKEEKDRAKKQLGEITAQVAHDIRSPLAAIDTIVSGSGNRPVSEQERVMMRTAFRRINNIANDLVAKYKGREHNPDTLVFVYVAIKDIVSEKDLEYGHQNIKFELVLDHPRSAFLLTEGNYTEMRRMFSNLINNAVNAMPDGGIIRVLCERTNNLIVVKIFDQGVGMSQQKISQLLSDDRIGRETGLGLKHAKAYIKLHGGNLVIFSEESKGTEVVLSFPVSAKPKWLAEKLEIDFTRSVMIIDDDASIHDIWTRKFEGFNISREDYYTTADVRTALREGRSRPGLILCDYEFIGQKETGLDLLEGLEGIDAQKYLVTTHVDNESILNRCEALGFQVIPKHLLPYISIQERNAATEQGLHERVAGSGLDAVLIDDGLYNHEFWQYMAKQSRKKLLCFVSLSDFELGEKNISLDTPIYIDLNLENASGLDVARMLYERGFKKLYIASGYIDFDIKSYPYLTGVVGKSPPF